MAAYLWVQGQNLSAAEEDGYGGGIKIGEPVLQLGSTPN